jgi:hypothetical protein
VTVLCFQAADGLGEALEEAERLYFGLLDTECQVVHGIRQAARDQLDALQVPLIEAAPIIEACSDLEEAESALRANDPARARSVTKAASADIREALRTLPAGSAARPVLQGMAEKLDDSRNTQDWLCWAKMILGAAVCVAGVAVAVAGVVAAAPVVAAAAATAAANVGAVATAVATAATTSEAGAATAAAVVLIAKGSKGSK